MKTGHLDTFSIVLPPMGKYTFSASLASGHLEEASLCSRALLREIYQQPFSILKLGSAQIDIAPGTVEQHEEWIRPRVQGRILNAGLDLGG